MASAEKTQGQTTVRLTLVTPPPVPAQSFLAVGPDEY